MNKFNIKINFLLKVKWLPAVLIMALIFYFSSRTSSDLPNYGIWDTLVKKSGHMIGYFLLSVADHYWFEGRKKKAVFFAVSYALLDEFHQSFTAGRHPSFVDVFVYDGIGIVLGSVFYNSLLGFIRTRVRIPRQ